MELKYLSIGRKSVKFGIVVNAHADEDDTVAKEERAIVAQEAPLPELMNAFGKLGPVFCKILEVDEAWADGLTVYRLTISHTKAGTRSVKMFATKQLECRKDFLHRVDCPFIQIDKPADGESGQIDIEDKKHLKLVLDAIKQAERYANGERSQSLLNFDEAKAALQATANIGQRELGFGS